MPHRAHARRYFLHACQTVGLGAWALLALACSNSNDDASGDAAAEGGVDAGDGGDAFYEPTFPEAAPEAALCGPVTTAAPVLTVIDRTNGKAICDVTLVNPTGQEEILDCEGANGCSGACDYTIPYLGDGGASLPDGAAITYSVTITAKGYGTTTLEGLVTKTCPCTTDTCAAKYFTASLAPDGDASADSGSGDGGVDAGDDDAGHEDAGGEDVKVPAEAGDAKTPKEAGPDATKNDGGSADAGTRDGGADATLG